MSPPSKTTRVSALVAGGAFILGGVVFGTLTRVSEVEARTPQPVSASMNSGAPAAESSAAEASATSPEFPADLPGNLTNVFVSLAASVTPAVVQVEVRRPASGSMNGLPDIPEPFRDFFNLPDRGRSQSEPPPETMAGGTGFIISGDGYILTNAHVVEAADRIMVNLLDRTSHEAELVGSDPTTDLAVIKIDESDLPTLQWGQSGTLQVGEPVMAVGNPGFGGAQSLDYTVTTGIVSAVGRPLSIIRQSLSRDPDLAGYAIENFIQTDAVINPGNSGGPLVDLWGRVVGVNSAIESSDGHYQGYGFAIPADLARKVSSDLMENGRVRRGWLGISVTGVSAEDAEVYGLPRVAGVLIQDLSEDGPAKKVGLQVEDVILSLNGVILQDSGDLQEGVAELGPGAKADLEVYRHGKRMEISVRLGEAPMSSQARVATAGDKEGPESMLGLAVTDLTPGLARQLGYDQPGGAVVTDVTPWSPAMRRGITPGLKIDEVDHQPTRDAESFRKAIGDLEPGGVVSLVVETPDGTTRIINLRADNR